MFYWTQEKEAGCEKSLQVYTGLRLSSFRNKRNGVGGQEVTSISKHLPGAGLPTTPVFLLYGGCGITKTICRWTKWMGLQSDLKHKLSIFHLHLLFIDISACFQGRRGLLSYSQCNILSDWCSRDKILLCILGGSFHTLDIATLNTT